MGYAISFTCDICGAPKKETNHWFVARVVNNLDGTGESYLKISKFTTEDAKLGRSVLCGETCVHKFISQNILTINPKKEVS